GGAVEPEAARHYAACFALAEHLGQPADRDERCAAHVRMASTGSTRVACRAASNEATAAAHAVSAIASRKSPCARSTGRPPPSTSVSGGNALSASQATSAPATAPAVPIS